MANQISITQVAYLVLATKYFGHERAFESKVCYNLADSAKSKLIHLFDVAERIIVATSIKDIMNKKRAPTSEFVTVWTGKLKEVVADVASGSSDPILVRTIRWTENEWRILFWIIALKCIQNNLVPKFFHFDLHVLAYCAVQRFAPQDLDSDKILLGIISPEILRELSSSEIFLSGIAGQISGRISEVNLALKASTKSDSVEKDVESFVVQLAATNTNTQTKDQIRKPPRVAKERSFEPSIDIALTAVFVGGMFLLLIVIGRDTYIWKIAWWHHLTGWMLAMLVFMIFAPLFKGVLTGRSVHFLFMGEPIRN